MTEIVQGRIERDNVLSPGFRVFIQFPDTKYIYRYEVLSVDEKTGQVTLLAIDYPAFSRVIPIEEYNRYTQFADKYMQSKGRVLECILHNILTVDGYEGLMQD